MYRILVVEDDMTIAKALASHLRKWDYEVACVEDFKNVMEIFAEYDPQLVLLDIVLPFFNGFHWCQEIRQLSKVPIIFISSAGDNMNIVMAMNMGGDEFIEKPFDLNVVTAKVQAMLRRTYAFHGSANIIEHHGLLLNLGDASLSYQGEKIELTKLDRNEKRNRIYGAGMRLTGRYIRDHIRGIGMYAGIMAIFALLFYLYNIPMDALEYALLLSLLWILGFVAADFMNCRRKHRELLRMKGILQVKWEELPKADTLAEWDYQQIVNALFESRSELESAAQLSRQDMLDYYVLWAHQIKTPIAAMRILLQSQELTEENEEAVKTLKMELFKIEQYVEMVLTYLRMESMSSDMVLQWYAADDIVKQAVKKYSQLFILKKIALRMDMPEEMILTDEKWLAFVVEQILSNALKYTSEGTVSIYMKEKELVIEDTGIGIQEEDVPRVFEKGFTGFNGRRDKKSTGIGLYLCKTILDRLGHSIRIESKVGEGTKVFLYLERDMLDPE